MVYIYSLYHHPLNFKHRKHFTSQNICNLAMEQKPIHRISTTPMHTTPLTKHKSLLIRLSTVVIISLHIQTLFIFLLNKLKLSHELLN